MILTRRKVCRNGKQRFYFLLSPTSPRLVSQAPNAASFLFATNRMQSFDETIFSGERANEIKCGTASVQIPDAHKIGKVELPFKLTLFSLTLYEQAPNPSKAFHDQERRYPTSGRMDESNFIL
jgi:esterase/lipase superfamily enzyme